MSSSDNTSPTKKQVFLIKKVNETESNQPSNLETDITQQCKSKTIKKKQRYIRRRNKDENEDNLNNGRWEEIEHYRFLKGCILYGNNWKKVKECVETRSSSQIRSHAQKFLIRLARKYRLNEKNKFKIFKDFHKENEEKFEDLFNKIESSENIERAIYKEMDKLEVLILGIFCLKKDDRIYVGDIDIDSFGDIVSDDKPKLFILNKTQSKEEKSKEIQTLKEQLSKKSSKSEEGYSPNSFENVQTIYTSANDFNRLLSEKEVSSRRSVDESQKGELVKGIVQSSDKKDTLASSNSTGHLKHNECGTNLSNDMSLINELIRVINFKYELEVKLNDSYINQAMLNLLYLQNLSILNDNALLHYQNQVFNLDPYNSTSISPDFINNTLENRQSNNSTETGNNSNDIYTMLLKDSSYSSLIRQQSYTTELDKNSLLGRKREPNS